MNKMPQITIVFGLLMLALGIAGYQATGYQFKTALIPSYFGVALIVCGWFARKERWLKHAMHAAAGLALIGLLGTVKSLLALPALISGAEVARPQAVVLQSIMAVLCVVFVALSVWSFVVIRRKAKQQ
jgi:membrane-bound ClpP family serine protease